MVMTMILCAALGVAAWFFGCIAVMWQKYHKIWEFIKVQTFMKKNKILVLLIYMLLGTGAGALFYTYGWMPTKILKYLILIYGVLVIAYIDYQSQLIPNFILLVLFAVRSILLIVELCTYKTAWMELLASAFGGLTIGFLLFILVYFISKKGMGLGDVKLVAVIGFYTGTAVLYMIIIFALLCCVLYSVVQLMRRKLTTKDYVAFGPFLAVGTIIALFLGV